MGTWVDVSQEWYSPPWMEGHSDQVKFMCVYVLRMVENKYSKTLMTSRGRGLGAFKEEVVFLLSIITNSIRVQSSLQKECQDFAQKKK